ncbi:MAG: GNAT family N-acetyltransferase [Actinomycetes bacterium]
MSVEAMDNRGGTARFEIREIADREELQLAMDLRRRVFCDEQGVPLSDEVDGRDPEGTHLIALDNGLVVGACRLTFAGSTAQFSRLAVDSTARRQGIATLLLEQAESAARMNRSRRIALHAQTYALSLYENNGYRTRGRPFFDAGIEHIAMDKRLG